MLTSLKIENFRGLSNLQIEKLGRINLIVGKNNCGKSTLLEAIRIFAKGANPKILREIAASHGEKYSVGESNGEDNLFSEDQEILFQNYFSGREFGSNDKSIYIGNIESTRFVKIEHALYLDEFQEIEDVDGETLRRRKRTRIEKNDLFLLQTKAQQALIVSSSESDLQGWIELGESYYPRRNQSFWDRAVSDTPLSYLPTQFLSLDYLAQLWDQIVLTPYEESVKRALKIVEKNVEEIAFVQTKNNEIRTSRRLETTERTAKIKLKGMKQGISLNSMGDGMLRVLQLAITLFSARNGFLLIDEFENGLHWTVQERIWDFVFELSTELNIQVFATTHSSDAVKTFAAAANNHPQQGMLIKLAKPELSIESGEALAIVASLDEVSLLAAAQAEIELR